MLDGEELADPTKATNSTWKYVITYPRVPN